MKSSACQARITGRVQGVAYRAWARARARSAGLTGWVLNEPTGSVLAHIQGPAEAVEKMKAELWSGPGAAAVRDVQSKRVAPDTTLSGFDIRR